MDTSCEDNNPILQASTIYADYLNNSSMGNHILNVVKNTSEPISIVPYCYFHREFMDYEPKQGTKFSNELKYKKYKKEIIDLENDEDIINYVVPLFKKMIPKSENICGLIGLPIFNDDDSEQDHYVSFVLKKNVLYYFDSAIDKDFRNTESFKILIYALEPRTFVANQLTFEIAGGVSESPFNYIAQNIFCHSWCLWFLYQMLVKKKTMKKINEIGFKGKTADKKNLILIKTFIYNELIPILKMNLIYEFGLFDSFRYILIDNSPVKSQEIIKVKEI